MFHRVVAAVVAAMLLGPAGPAGATEHPPVPASPFGAYLAAQHAAKNGDYETAAAYFRLLVREGQPASVLVDALNVFVANGEIEYATELTKRMAAAGMPAGGLPTFLLFADAVRGGDLELARSQLEATAPGGSVDGHVLPVLHAWVAATRDPPAVALAPVDQISERGVLPSFYHYYAARILALAGAREAATARYLAALGETGGPARVALSAYAHFSAVGALDHARRVRRELDQRHPPSGTLLTLREGAEVRLPVGPVSFAAPPAAGAPAGGLVTPEAAVAGVAETLFDAGRIALAQNFHAAALAYVRLAEFLQPAFPATRLLVGYILEQVDATEAARTAYRDVPADAPEAWDAGLGLSRVLERMDRVDEARFELRVLADRHPGRAGALSVLGEMLSSAKEFERAEEVFSEALGRVGEASAHHWPLYFRRGVALERTGRWERAEADFQRALELAPDQPFVLNYLAYSWIEQGRRLEEARGMAARATELEPDNGFFIDSLGWAYYQLGDYERAAEILERAMAAEPMDPVITSHYGDALWRAGRRAEAVMQWRNALEADPDPALAEEIERKLEHGFDEEPPAAEGHEI